MALDQIHLRKLLMLVFADRSLQRSKIHTDIREVEAKERGQEASGGDFYTAFWADVKSFVFDGVDLNESVKERISVDWHKKNLYPQLRDGFLLWWMKRRRWTNEPFQPGRNVKGRDIFPGIDAIVKIENFLSVKDGRGVERLIYPYFSPEPVLSEKAARWGLWIITTILPDVPKEEFRILDVIRGQTFSLDRQPLTGTEEQEFRAAYKSLLAARDEIIDEKKKKGG